MGRGPVRLPRRVGPGGRTTEFAANGWSAAEAERRIVDEPVEWLYVFDPVGRQVARFQGTEDEVDLSDELKSRTNGLYGESTFRNHLLVHNHPPIPFGPDSVASFPPSPTDLLLAIERDLKGFIILSGADRYVLSRPGDYWPTDEFELSHIYDRIVDHFDRQITGKSLGSRRTGVARVLFAWINYERTIQQGRL